jgi:SAM-dependent methyltransferase
VDADAARWDRRYRDHGAVIPCAPIPFDAHPDLIGLLPTDGRALDVACGLGAQAAWLARRGLNVTALDVSVVAVDSVRTVARTHGVGDRVSAQLVDLDDGLDVVNGPFDVVLCQRFRRPELYPSLHGLLGEHGLGIVTVLSTVGADVPGPYHAPAGELVTAFAHATIVHSLEGDGSASVVFRR